MIRDAFLGVAIQDPGYVKKFRVPSNFSEPLAHEPRHIFHCLDYLRQTIMCNADTTLEWRSEGDPAHIDGYGPTHQCRNWDEVRQWLGANMPPDIRFHRIDWWGIDSTMILDPLFGDAFWDGLRRGEFRWHEAHRRVACIWIEVSVLIAIQ